MTVREGYRAGARGCIRRPSLREQENVAATVRNKQQRSADRRVGIDGSHLAEVRAGIGRLEKNHLLVGHCNRHEDAVRGIHHH